MRCHIISTKGIGLPLLLEPRQFTYLLRSKSEPSPFFEFFILKHRLTLPDSFLRSVKNVTSPHSFGESHWIGGGLDFDSCLA